MFFDYDRVGLRVKICGITNLEDAKASIAAGADALGFNCYVKSKRYVDLAAAGEWIARLPDHISRVAVVVDPTFGDATAIAALPFISALQLHGRETPDFCRRLAAEGVRFSKALPATDAASLRDAALYSTQTIVLDSATADAFGGTGLTFDWRIAARFAEVHPASHVILAGGLTPENVSEAVAIARPYAVDVTSGVEASPGRKDYLLLRSFIDAARAS
jgi:phosphoribosylanthranilate isomerase